MIQSIDYAWRELLETADVVSEGAVRAESDGLVYYGSTSVLLLISSRRKKGACEKESDELLQLLTADPHARVRAVRIACLEAQLRAGHAIGAVKAELAIRKDDRGVRIDIDVEARVLPEQSSRRQTKLTVKAGE